MRTQNISNLKQRLLILTALFLIAFSTTLLAQENCTFIKPNNTKIQIEGSNYIKMDGNELVIHRHSDAIYKGTTKTNLFNPNKARSSSGIILKFKTSSPLVKVKLKMMPGGKRGPVFAIFQNNEFVRNKNFKYQPDTEITLNLVASKAGEAIEYKIAFPTFTDIHLLGLELEKGFDIVAFPEEEKPTYVAFGDSITHGTGQSTTPETYPYLLAEKFGYELFNVAVGGGKTSQVLAEMIRDDFKNIELITVLIGFNDYNGEGIDIKTYEKRYTKVLSTLREKHPNTNIVCISLLTTKAKTSKKTGIAAKDFRKVVSTVVANKQAKGDTKLYLINGASITTEADLRDIVHLSPQGATNFADKLYHKINTIVKNK